MVSVARIVEKLVSSQPYLEDAMSQGILNLARVSQELAPQIASELGHKATDAAIIMALHRLSDRLKAQRKSERTRISLSGIELAIRSDIVEITAVRAPDIFDKLHGIYALVEHERGDTLNIIHGTYEVSIIANKKYKRAIEQKLKGEKILSEMGDLALLSIKIPPKIVTTPGFFATITRTLAWNGINIYESVSTLTEYSLVLGSKDATRAYSILQDALKKD
jgi:aspartokinase